MKFELTDDLLLVMANVAIRSCILICALALLLIIAVYVSSRINPGIAAYFEKNKHKVNRWIPLIFWLSTLMAIISGGRVFSDDIVVRFILLVTFQCVGLYAVSRQILVMGGYKLAVLPVIAYIGVFVFTAIGI